MLEAPVTFGVSLKKFPQIAVSVDVPEVVTFIVSIRIQGLLSSNNGPVLL